MIRAPNWTYAVIGLIAVSAAVLLLTANAGRISPWATTRTITIDAHQFAFQPSTVTVNQGDRVKVEVIATDVTHGFYLDSYGVEAAAQPGRPATVEFVADRAGTFRFRCSMTCGPLHPFMIGELTILPAARTSPSPFAASFVLAGLLAIGTVAWTWKTAPRQEVRNG